MTVKERLIRFLKYKNISQKDFANKVGVSSGYVNAIRESIQPKTLNKIAMQFPDLNKGWLMTGDGEMIISDSSPPGEGEDYRDKYIKLLEKTNQEQSEIIAQYKKCLERFEYLEEKKPPSQQEKTGSG